MAAAIKSLFCRTFCQYLSRHVSLNDSMFLSFKSVKYACFSTNSDCLPHGISSESRSYDEVESARMNQARRTLLIQEVAPTNQLITYCQHRGGGPIANAISYKHNSVQYTLLEYRDLSSVRRFMSATRQFPNNRRIPVESRFILFRPSRNGSERLSVVRQKPVAVDVCETFGENPLKDSDLLACDNLSSQIKTLCEKISMSDLDIRLRYFLCSAVEDMVRCIFPSADVRLFGSSVSGLGRYDCDMDMVMDIDQPNRRSGGGNEGTSFFLTKMRPETNSRAFNQRTLTVIGGILQEFMPQIIQVRRILKARIPILKFLHIGTNIDCDLSLDNQYATDMSRLLRCLCQLDVRVAPLVFTVRQWARSNGVTRSTPGPWISNFMITLLVVFHLQSTKPTPVLPPFTQLKTLTSPLVHVTDDISIPTSKILSKTITSHDQTLDHLLIDFFKFYAGFDFSHFALSLVDGTVTTRTDLESSFASIHIENPLERELNVSKNVHPAQLQQFQALCATAVASLEGSQTNSGNVTGVWGLLTILKTNGIPEENDTEANDTEHSENAVMPLHSLVESDSSTVVTNGAVDEEVTKRSSVNRQKPVDSRSVLDSLRMEKAERDQDLLLAAVERTAAKLNVRLKNVLSDDEAIQESINEKATASVKKS